MKKVYRYFLTGVLAMGVFASCQNEDEYPVPELDTVEIGVIPRASIDNAGLINPLDFDNTDVLFTVDAYSDGEVDIRETEISLTYNGRVNYNNSDPDDDSTFSITRVLTTTSESLPVQLSFGTAELEALFGVPRDSFDLGETFEINYAFITEDNKRLEQWSNDVCNEPAYNGTCSLEVAVSCPSSIPAGQYTVVAYTNQDISQPNTFTVTINAAAGTQFTIPNFNLDFQTGFYLGFNTLPISGGFVDICNTVTLNTVGDFGVIWSGEGTYDPDNQTIFFPSISDPGYGQGPWTNAGQGYLLEYTGN